ncbi:NAD-dependent epimerase/dehydratase family protein [Lacticaseibacillus sharpeae]|uniref:NAD-dependent epimerase/dehydratase family protein n=1 Tax=Lacticaseibacillus sharpeae TaxID=1626 RepID=UPI000A9B379B|nr:NAD-dependent epimerase/dehydratase family protein [Lacticaseibacillus sharpeae]
MNYQSEIIQRDLELIVQQSVDWEKLRGSTVLISGVTGMLATYMAFTLRYLNHKYDLNIKAILTYRNKKKLENKFAGMLDYDKFQFVQNDVVDYMNVDGPVDWIIHAASNASPKYILSDPVGIIEANTVGTKQLLKLALEKHSKGFHFLSTREVYGQSFPGVNTIAENQYGALNTLEARSCYPESKRLAETLIESFSNQYGMPFTISRIAHSYGPGMAINSDGRIMSDLIYDAVNARDIVLKSKGDAERAFCYVADAVAAIFMVMLNGDNKNVYNVANEDNPISIAKLAQEFVDIFPERNLKVVFDIPASKSELMRSLRELR